MAAEQALPIVVTGASSAVAGFLLAQLKSAGTSTFAISRQARPAQGTTWIRADIATDEIGRRIASACALVHATPITLLPALLKREADAGWLRRVVALSSTSVVTKLDSSDRRDRALAARLAEAEQDSWRLCEAAGIPLTILRPTLIYGGSPPGGLGQVRRLGWSIGVFPLVGKACGLRQPVHAEDVATACLQALRSDATPGRSYAIPGGETLTYREMISRVLAADGHGTRLVTVPPFAARAAVRLLGFLPAFAGLSPAVADRMNQDLVFDSTDAARDFGYRPRGFSGSL